MKTRRLDFWEWQERQKRISVGLFLFVFLFYFLTSGIISAAVLLGVGIFSPGFNFWENPVFLPYLTLLLLLTGLLTFINFWQAKKAGVNFILQRLKAYPPDPEDRYHLTFQNVLEEMRLAAGLPAVKGYIVPSLNINSFSLSGSGNQPIIGVTEGLLAEATRDELQAAVAHETSHILRGDTRLLTLVCTLVSFYERLVSSLERETEQGSEDVLWSGSKKGTVHPLLSLAGWLSFSLMSFLSLLVTRQRELLADATAVEFSRDPLALGRIIYKAHVANSFLGDFSLYTPLFLVPPDSREITDSLPSKLFNTHPPVLTRLKILTAMAHKSVGELIAEVRERESMREKARLEARASEEIGQPSHQASMRAGELHPGPENKEEKVWLVKSGRGWVGPYSLSSLLARPGFSPGIRVKNIKDNREGKAGEFAAISSALNRLLHHQAIDLRRVNKCPQCDRELTEIFYEGVKIKTCPHCRGKLVALEAMDKILARKEVGFSPRLQAKAKKVRENIALLSLAKKQALGKPVSSCPQCGLQMTVKPFNYQLLLPVYKCYHCSLVWFPADELEILQFLAEEKDAR